MIEKLSDDRSVDHDLPGAVVENHLDADDVRNATSCRSGPYDPRRVIVGKPGPEREFKPRCRRLGGQGQAAGRIARKEQRPAPVVTRIRRHRATGIIGAEVALRPLRGSLSGERPGEIRCPLFPSFKPAFVIAGTACIERGVSHADPVHMPCPVVRPRLFRRRKNDGLQTVVSIAGIDRRAPFTVEIDLERTAVDRGPFKFGQLVFEGDRMPHVVPEGADRNPVDHDLPGAVVEDHIDADKVRNAAPGRPGPHHALWVHIVKIGPERELEPRSCRFIGKGHTAGGIPGKQQRAVSRIGLACRHGATGIVSR